MAACRRSSCVRLLQTGLEHWNKPLTIKSRSLHISHITNRAASTSKSVPKLENEAIFTQEIIIPKRIERGPTDILKALASTVSRDYTAPHYKYHDDPFLIPASNLGKRSYALSKEAGQKAAQWIFQTYPKYFEKDLAVPSIEKFMPREKYDENSEVSESILNVCIYSGEVTNAITVYQLLLGKGIVVSDETKENLLELLCFYNCTDPPPEEHREDKWFRQNVAKERRQTWKDGSFAEQLFDSFETKSAKIYCSLLRGMAKHFLVDRAYNMYQDMIEKGIALDLQTYNTLIPLSVYLKENGESRWQMAESFLISMRTANIYPDLGTFNAVLEVLSRVGHWNKVRRHALETLGEMKHLNIEPSLATYYHLLNIFCKERGPTSTILVDIMENIKGREFLIRDPYDVFFFVTAMNVCHTHLMDRDIALSIHDLLLTGNNYTLIGDSLKESIYYQNFFKILCNTENVDVFFEYYNKLVPNVYIPEPSVMIEILQLIETFSEWQYIPQMWTDIVLFSHLSRSNILEKVAEILAKHKPEGELQEQFVNIAWDLKRCLDSQREDKLRAIVYWTGDMLGNILQTCLNAGEYGKACELLHKTETDSSKIVGTIKSNVLNNFLEACIEKKDAKAAVYCVRYAADSGVTESSNFAKKVLDALTLTESQRIRVTSLLSSEDVHVEQKVEGTSEMKE